MGCIVACSSRTALSGAVSDIILAVTERQIAPGETACFPFVARTAYGIPSIHEFNVISDNPNFNPDWVRLRQSAGDSYGPHYILEINPGDIGRAQYGVYPLHERYSKPHVIEKKKSPRAASNASS